jgi:DNA-binding CsgD family transcriptional regulator
MKLSTFETLCLRWASQGKSLEAAVVIEGVDARYIQAHLDRAVTALRVRSVAEAIRKATDLRII